MHNEQTIDGRARRFRVGAFIGGRRLPLFFLFSPDLTNLVTMADFPRFDRARRGSCIWETVRQTFPSLRKPIVERKGVDRWAPESKSNFLFFFSARQKKVSYSV